MPQPTDQGPQYQLCIIRYMVYMYKKLAYLLVNINKILSLFIMPPPVGKGTLSVAFCPSVRLYVAYIANNWRNRRPSVPKFGLKVPHLCCDLHTSFRVKRSKIKVTRTFNVDTHRAPYLPNGKAYELQTWYTDGGRRPASATCDMTSNVKG